MSQKDNEEKRKSKFPMSIFCNSDAAVTLTQLVH